MGRFSPLIWKFVHRHANRLHMDKDDLRQELWLASWNAQRNFDPTRNVKFITYLYKTLSACVFNLYMRQMASKRTPRDKRVWLCSGNHSYDLHRCRVYHDNQFIRHEDSSDVMILFNVERAMRRLPLRTRWTFALSIAGFFHRSIAAALGVSPSTVSSMIKNARRAMRESLSDE